MKKQVLDKGRNRGFWRRNGVYMAVTASLVAVAILLISGTWEEWKRRNESQVSEEPVEQIVTNQPDDRTTTTTTTSTQVRDTTTTQQAQDLYVLPLTNTVQKPFSVDTPVYSATMKDWRIHSGVDFAGAAGQTVKAMARGEVVSLEEDPLWGWVITIDHGVGVVSRYCGVEPSVRIGDKPDASSPIGTLAEIPCELAQPSHLHFELYVDGVPINSVEAIALEVRYADTVE